MPKRTVAQINERLNALDAERVALQLKRKERLNTERKASAAEEAALIKVQGRVLVGFLPHFAKVAPDAAATFEEHLANWLKRAYERAAFGLPPLADPSSNDSI